MKRYRYKKSYRTKDIKSILKNKFFWLVFISLLILGGSFYFFLFSSFFQIKEIKISGNNKIAFEKIKKIAEEKVNEKNFFLISKNILLIDFKEIKRIIEDFPAASAVLLRRKFPDVITIDIEERAPVAVWCLPVVLPVPAEPTQTDLSSAVKEEKTYIKDDCYYIDKNGVIFEKTEEKKGLVIKSGKEIVFGRKIVDEYYLKNILDIYKEIKENQQINVKEINIADQEEKLVVSIFEGWPASVKATAGWEIYFNPKRDISEQIVNLKLVLKEKIPLENRGNLEYIDLRFGNRVFYRYKK